MDFDGLFWIALLVFYFLSRALGGGKKKTGQRPAERRPQRSPQQRQPAQRQAQKASQGDELAEALDEIRRALGFPSSEPSTAPKPQEEQRPASASPPVPERQDSPRAVESAPHRPVQRTAPRFPRPAASTGSTPRIPVGAGIPDGTELRGSTPAYHPRESSFAEEEAFERLGRHDHVEAPEVVKSISPYDTPARSSSPRIQPAKLSRSSLRDAFIMKEVLDKPLALRRR